MKVLLQSFLQARFGETGEVSLAVSAENPDSADLKVSADDQLATFRVRGLAPDDVRGITAGLQAIVGSPGFQEWERKVKFGAANRKTKKGKRAKVKPAAKPRVERPTQTPAPSPTPGETSDPSPAPSSLSMADQEKSYAEVHSGSTVASPEVTDPKPRRQRRARPIVEQAGTEAA